MRLIDAIPLSEGIELHRQSTDQEYELDYCWAEGFNAGLDCALHCIAYAETITPSPNDPLTLEELRDAALEDLRGRCWCCVHGKPWEPAGPLSKLTGCDHLSEFGVLARGGGKCKCTYWEWRGPQELVPESDTK